MVPSKIGKHGFTLISCACFSNRLDLRAQTNLGGLLTPPTGMDRAKDWRGLDQERQLLIKYDELDRYLLFIELTCVAYNCLRSFTVYK